MKHNDKTSQSDNSTRLDALLSNFLDKDIVVPVEQRSSHPTHPTSAPLGDLFPEVGSATRETSQAPSTQTPAVVQKVASVNRTEVWEATNRTARLPRPQSSSLENLAADRLEMSVDSVLEASQAAARGKKLLFGSIAVILMLAAGLLIRQSRRAASSQQPSDEPTVTVSPSEIDALLPGPGSVPEANSGTTEAETP